MNQSPIHQFYNPLCLLSSVFCPRPSTTVEDSLQISPFLTNKANFRKSQMNVSPVITREYKNNSNWTLGENKPNSNPIKANQTQLKPIKPNSKPKQTQTNPISLLPKSPRRLILDLFASNGFERFQYEPAQYQHHCHQDYQQQNLMLFRPRSRFLLKLSK